MASFVQLEEGNFHNGLLPPLRELLLEIQVNKLIQEYLFASNADEMCESLQIESSEKEIKATDQFYAANMAVQSACDACDAPCVMATDRQSPHDPHHTQTVGQSITCIEENEINGKIQTATGESLQTGYAAQSVDNEHKLAYITALLNRADSFPCTSKAQLQVGTLKKANTGMKVSGKKPPRPPRVPKSELASSLTRCCSDNGAYMQSSRRVKPERKRKAGAATSSVDTSIYALMFTLCFAVIMIAQGFWSQDSHNLTAYSSDVSSPAVIFVEASSKVLPAEVSLAGPAGRQASLNGVLAQFDAMRKLQAQHLSDMNHMLHLRAG